MDLRELRSFCAVAQFGSITNAAEQLMLRQPAVTLHIQELERETGVTLLDRSKRPVQLTPAGVHLAELAKPLLRQIDSLPVETSSYAKQGSLTVASTSEMTRNMLVDSIVAYSQTYPDTRLSVRSGRLPEVLRMVRDRDADLGFVPLTGRFSEFNVEPLFTNERVLLAAKGTCAGQPIESLHRLRSGLSISTWHRDNPPISGKLNERVGLQRHHALTISRNQALRERGLASAGTHILTRRRRHPGIVGLGPS